MHILVLLSSSSAKLHCMGNMAGIQASPANIMAFGIPYKVRDPEILSEIH